MPDDPVDQVLGHIFAGQEHLLSGSAPDLERFARPVRQALLSMHLRSAEGPIKYPEAHGALPQNRPSVVPPIVLDANRLRNGILYARRSGRRTVLVNAANAGLVRLCCAQHVVHEVAEHAAEWTTGSEVDLKTFLHRWLVEYLPLIRVLQNDDLPPTLLTSVEQARIEKLRVEDPDDIPSVTLALSIGTFYLSGDGKALAAVYGPDVDLAEHDRWLEVLKAGGDASELGEMLQMAIALVGGIDNAAAYGTKALM